MENESASESLRLHNTTYVYSLTDDPPIDLDVVRQQIEDLSLEEVYPSVKQAYRLKRRTGFRLYQANKEKNTAVSQPLQQKFLAVSLILELLLAKKSSLSHENDETSKTFPVLSRLYCQQSVPPLD